MRGIGDRFRGFSLLELVVVLAIIGLISAMAVPSFTRVRDRAKETIAKNQTYSIQMAIEMYFLNKGAYPTGSNMKVPALVTVLAQSGELKKTPVNPYTGQIYTSSDTDGRILYSLGSDKTSYTLTAYGRGDLTILELENL